MRNMLGGLLAAFIGSLLLVYIFDLSQPAYPQEVIAIWALLVGSHSLSQSYTIFLDPFMLASYLLVWLIMGLVIAPFSKSGWNAVRSAVWTGVWVSIWALTSILLLNPAFWSDPNRNLDLLLLFTTTIIAASLTLLSAYPISRIIRIARRERELPIPEKIETICECGAVFKSKPLVCSECGRTLSEEDASIENS
ncbi:MAG: hypothetical protein ACW960_04915 [Candidatus Thorarchaeota archaeon]|jgi:hypothetical protein